jgi:3-hydroxyisobutyrate dehydrogenase-like beta-hydroxyacid dehydrogenase
MKAGKDIFMKFRILLWLLGRMMQRAMKKDMHFKKLVSRGDAVYQLMTMDGGVVRHYAFSGGSFSSSASPHPEPDCVIRFQDTAKGFAVLTSKEKDAFALGMKANEIAVEGGFRHLVGFQRIAGLLKKSKVSAVGAIGFVGVGFIGAPMARSLMTGGFTVKAYDRNPQALEMIARDGAVPCHDISALADAKAVIIMVNTMDQVNEVVEELCRALPAAASLPLIVMSTVSPDEVRALRRKLDGMARKSIELLDAPVSGAPLLAEAGKLAIMVGGEKKVFDKVKPVLESMGDPDKIFYMGHLGTGSAMKLVNNIIGISAGLVALEAMDLGCRAGLDPDVMAGVINESSGKNFLTDQWPFTKMLFEMMLKDTMYNAKEAIFTTGIKDLETARKWAGNNSVQLKSAGSAVSHINDLGVDELVSIIKRLLKKE